VRTVSVLPGIPTRLTAAQVSALHLDPCFVNRTYWFEPVPTDVELGHYGQLYVTSLPGGPEGPELGARGSVFRVNAYTGRACRVVGGFLGATGLAVSRHGTLYVAELFGNRISRVRLGYDGPDVSTFATPTQPGDVEWTPYGLVATTNVLSGTDGSSAPAGQLVRYGFEYH
jgi:hypothetical protein